MHTRKDQLYIYKIYILQAELVNVDHLQFQCCLLGYLLAGAISTDIQFCIHLNLTCNGPCFHRTTEVVSSASNTNDKLKRDSSETGTKMAPAERLRPIGASAEEEVCESEAKLSTDDKQQEGGGERAVHIIIKPQGEVDTERKDSQELSHCLAPII